MSSSSPKPRQRPKYLGSTESHPLEHAEDAEDTVHEDELIGASPHAPAEDLEAEEPFGETSGSTETS